MAIDKKYKNIEEKSAGDIGAGDTQNTVSQDKGTTSGASNNPSLSSTATMGGAGSTAPKKSSDSLSKAGSRFASLKKFRQKNAGTGLANKIVGGLRKSESNVSGDVDAANTLLQDQEKKERGIADIGTSMGSANDGKGVASTANDFSYNPDGTRKTEDTYSVRGQDNKTSYIDSSKYDTGPDSKDFQGLDWDKDGKLNKNIGRLENHGQNMKTEQGRYKELKNRFGGGRRSYNAGTSAMDQLTLQDNAANRNLLKGATDLGQAARGLHTASGQFATDKSADIIEQLKTNADTLTGQVTTETANAQSLAKDKLEAAKIAQTEKLALIKRSNEDPSSITAAEAQELGWVLDPATGTYSNMGLGTNESGTNLDKINEGSVLSEDAKNQIASLNGLTLPGNVTDKILDTYGANRTYDENGNITEGITGDSDVTGQIVDNGFKQAAIDKQGELQGFEGNLDTFKNTTMGTPESINPGSLFEGLGVGDFYNTQGMIPGSDNMTNQELFDEATAQSAISNDQVNKLNSELADINAYNKKHKWDPFTKSIDNSTVKNKIVALREGLRLYGLLINNFNNKNDTLTQKVTDITGGDKFTRTTA